MSYVAKKGSAAEKGSAPPPLQRITLVGKRLKRYVDLISLFIIVLLVAICGCEYLSSEASEASPNLIIAITATILSFILVRFGKRMTMTAVFRADIGGLLDILKDLEILRVYGRLHENPTLAKGWAAIIDGEDYFATFSNNSNNMGFLQSTTAAEITSFYLYLKAARDLRRHVAAWYRGSENKATDVNEAIKREDVEKLVKMLQKCIEHGIKALRLLGVEYSDNNKQLEQFVTLGKSAKELLEDWSDPECRRARDTFWDSKSPK